VSNPRPTAAHLRRLLAHVRTEHERLGLSWPKALRTEWQRLELAALEAAIPWLEHSLALEQALEQRRCPASPAGRGHRVRVREAQLGGVMIEGCRCGAVRRFDRRERYASDWEVPETPPLLSPQKP
jgi:hypothetical protein